jgi:hypothetical protein
MATGVLAAMSFSTRSIVEQIVRAFGLRHCAIQAELGGGISGSKAFLVHYVEPSGGELRLGVVKITQRREDYEREVLGHANAAASWLQPIVAGMPRQAEQGQSYLLLSDIAMQADERGRNESLHEAIEDLRQATAISRVACCLARFYGEGVRSALVDEPSWSDASIGEIARQILQPWNDRLRSSDWEKWGFPGVATPEFIDGTDVFVNPLWAAFHAEAWKLEAVPMPLGMQHHDLNLRNILVSLDAAERGESLPFVMIDWEKCDRTSMYFDLCWAALWSLVASAKGKERLDSPSWQAVPEAFVAAVAHGKVRRGCGAFDGGLAFASELGNGLKAHLSGSLADISMQLAPLLLTVGAAALVKSFYEVRDLSRCRDSGGGAIDLEMVRWSILFFRISAIAWRQSAFLQPGGGGAGDLAWADVSGLGNGRDIARIQRLAAGEVTVDDLVHLRAIGNRQHPIVDIVIQRVRERIVQDKTLASDMASRLGRLLRDGQSQSLEEAKWLLSLCPLNDEELFAALAPRDQVEVIIAWLQVANREGKGPADFSHAGLLQQLHGVGLGVPPESLFRADLLQAASYENIMDFDAASQLLRSRWPEEVRRARGLGVLENAQFFSALGRHDAFRREYASADSLFDQALDACAELGDPARARHETKIRTFKVLSILQRNASEAIESCEELFDRAMNCPRHAAAVQFAQGGVETEYLHHVYLRLVYDTQETERLFLSAYLSRQDLWKAYERHPWELIDMYRGLLSKDDNPQVARKCLKRAAQWAVAKRGMIGVIGVVVCGVGVCSGLVDDEDLIERALGFMDRVFVKLAPRFDCEVLRSAFEKPSPQRVPELLAVLPFSLR